MGSDANVKNGCACEGTVTLLAHQRGPDRET